MTNVLEEIKDMSQIQQVGWWKGNKVVIYDLE